MADDARQVIADVFDQADRRDPEHQADRVALVDGNRHQIDRITAEAKARGLTVTPWSTGCTCWSTSGRRRGASTPRATPPPRTPVHTNALDVLRGTARIVAAAIRRKATTLGLDPPVRKNADTCTDYQWFGAVP